MRPEQILVTSKNQTRIWVEGQETCREYYKTDKITFGMSELLPGAVGDLDPGHSKCRGKSSAMFRKTTRITV